MTEVLFYWLFGLAATSFVLSIKWPREMKIVCLTLFGGGVLLYFLVLGLYQLGITLFGMRPLRPLWWGLALGYVGFSCLLGHVLERAGSGGRLTAGILLAALISGIAISGFSLIKESYVERFIFDKTAPRMDSDYIKAYGFPAAYMSDLAPNIKNWPGTRGDTFVIKPFLTNLVVWTYLALLVFLNAKRLVHFIVQRKTGHKVSVSFE